MKAKAAAKLTAKGSKNWETPVKKIASIRKAIKDHAALGFQNMSFIVDPSFEKKAVTWLEKNGYRVYAADCRYEIGKMALVVDVEWSQAVSR